MSLIQRTIKRVLKTTAVAAALALVATTANAADKVYRLKLAETWGPNFPIFGDATKNMAKMAEEMSNGRLQIRIDSANKHKAPLGVFDMVKSGQYDLGHSASYYWKGKVPNTLYFTSMPFGMLPAEQYAWFLPRRWDGIDGEGVCTA
ncbi:TRAP transporter solute receptor [Vibrio vulnificus]|nr:TRAP transporter solute receptor [Vibrio vulnificus]